MAVIFAFGNSAVPSSSRTQGVDKGATIAFLNVNVVPMDRERVIRNQTVIVRDGLISEIGDASRTKTPADALRIDGRGKYLVPGLIDMHTHLFSDDEFPDHLAADEFMIMVANGVTTIRLMIGTPEHLALRKRIESGELIGPALYIASPEITGRNASGIFNGITVKTPDEARRAVRESKQKGYDFIKLTTEITPEVYSAVVAAARESGIRVIGHVDTKVGLHRALAAGQQIEHLDSYMEAVLKDDSPIKASVSDVGVYKKANWESLDYIDERKVDEAAKATAKAGVYSCPTLTFFKASFAVRPLDEEIRSRPDYRFFPQKMRESRHRALNNYWAAAPTEERRERYLRIRYRLVKGIHDAGGKIMAGSDTPEFFLLYGWTLHRELRNLVAAGLTPYAALEAATRNPAEFVKALDRIGTVKRGKRADLILLEANPLEDISNTEKISGVMSRGRWMTSAELRKRLDEIAPRLEIAG